MALIEGVRVPAPMSVAVEYTEDVRQNMSMDVLQTRVKGTMEIVIGREVLKVFEPQHRLSPRDDRPPRCFEPRKYHVAEVTAYVLTEDQVKDIIRAAQEKLVADMGQLQAENTYAVPKAQR